MATTSSTRHRLALAAPRAPPRRRAAPRAPAPARPAGRPSPSRTCYRECSKRWAQWLWGGWEDGHAEAKARRLAATGGDGEVTGGRQAAAAGPLDKEGGGGGGGRGGRQRAVFSGAGYALGKVAFNIFFTILTLYHK